MPLDFEKLADLVHYICSNAPGGAHLDMSVLNKMLFFSECRVYQDRGTPITGESYFRQEGGPASAHLESVLHGLRDQERIGVTDTSAGEIEVDENRGGLRFLSLRSPDTDRFEQRELELVGEVVERIGSRDAEGVLGSLFEAIALGCVDMGEELPMMTVYSNLFEDMHPEEMEWW